MTLMNRTTPALMIPLGLALALGGCGPSTQRGDTSMLGPIAPSGMARVDANTYLVTSDVPASSDLPRLGLLDVTNDDPAYKELVANWIDHDGTANDLQSACTIPGRPGEFLVAESGYEGDRFGRVFHLTLEAGEKGAMQARIRQVLKLPRLYDRIHGMTCGQSANGDLILMFCEFGSPGRMARLSWGRLEFHDGVPAFQFRGDLSFAAPVLPDTSRTIDCADLFVSADNALWVVATIDDGPRGPFRSIIYRLGAFDARRHQPMVSPDPLVPTWTLDGFRVRAIAAAPDDPRGLCVLTDDGNFGSIWRELER